MKATDPMLRDAIETMRRRVRTAIFDGLAAAPVSRVGHGPGELEPIEDALLSLLLEDDESLWALAAITGHRVTEALRPSRRAHSAPSNPPPENWRGG